jgi:hypothetical protein
LADLIAASAASDAAWSEALRWYRMAADGGHESAKARLIQFQETRNALERERSVTSASG